MINLIANTIEMSFDVPSSEQKEAEVAYDHFKKVISVMDSAKEHLNIIYDPFKAAGNIDPDALHKYRGAIYRYKEQIKKNFNKVKAYCLVAIIKLNPFGTDTHVSELIGTFRDSVSDLEKQIGILLDILDDLKSAEIRDNIISGIEAVRKECFNIEKLINERILDYINANILAKNWVSNTSNDLKMKIEDKIPYITQLFKERQEALEGIK